MSMAEITEKLKTIRRNCVSSANSGLSGFNNAPCHNGRMYFPRKVQLNRPVNNPRQYGIDGFKRMIDKWGRVARRQNHLY